MLRAFGFDFLLIRLECGHRRGGGPRAAFAREPASAHNRPAGNRIGWAGILLHRLPCVFFLPTYGYAACFSTSFCATSDSAICTAFNAAPLRKLSETHQKPRPFGTVGSRRMRLT